MARRNPTMPVSPQQLKHFAAATVALTILLALFVSGQDAGIATQAEANRVKNDLVSAEQRKLGTKKLVAKLSVKNAGMGSFGNDSGPSGDGGGGYSQSGSASQPSRRGGAAGNPGQPAGSMSGRLPQPGQKLTRTGPSRKRTGPALPSDDTESSGSGQSHRPDSGQLSKIIDASLQRSGGSNSSDD